MLTQAQRPWFYGWLLLLPALNVHQCTMGSFSNQGYVEPSPNHSTRFDGLIGVGSAQNCLQMMRLLYITLSFKRALLYWIHAIDTNKQTNNTLLKPLIFSLFWLVGFQCTNMVGNLCIDQFALYQ